VAKSAPADTALAPSSSAAWAAGLYANFLPDETYLLPTVALSWGHLYAEGRYQYEDLHTGSLWLGRSCEGGQALAWWIAPMAGVAFGRTNGLAPGLVAELQWRQLSLSTSAEYLFDLEDEDASFFYSWTEWLVHLHELFTPGITLERSRPRDTDLVLNTGLTLYSTVRNVTGSFYAFNPWDSEDDYYVLGIGTEF
jgi:hypothetical protein